MDIKDFVIINPLTGEAKKVSETEYKQHRKDVNSFWMKHHRNKTCTLESYSKAAALCPMVCNLCEHSCLNCVSLDEMFENIDQDKCTSVDNCLVDNNSPDLLYEKKVLYKKLYEKIDALSEIEKQICFLFMEGASFNEISIELNTCLANVYKHFERIKDFLREELKDYI
ncbi:MAG: hypothetical protein MJ177_05130 [Clostridia bacterium]|nr:hypothetical protein [Clostridia bacterium]